MDNTLYITANLDQPDLLENLVEKLANRRYDIGYSSEKVPQNWQAVETASAEIYASGIVSFSGFLDNDDAFINMPFITTFLFTCTKAKNDEYRLTWSSSLS